MAITASKDINWDEMDVQKVYDAIARIIGKRENLDIKIKVYKKSDLTPEQIEAIERNNKEKIENLGR